MLLEHCKTWNRLALVNTDHKWQKPPECSFFVRKLSSPYQGKSLVFTDNHTPLSISDIGTISFSSRSGNVLHLNEAMLVPKVLILFLIRNSGTVNYPYLTFSELRIPLGPLTQKARHSLTALINREQVQGLLFHLLSPALRLLFITKETINRLGEIALSGRQTFEICILDIDKIRKDPTWVYQLQGLPPIITMATGLDSIAYLCYGQSPFRWPYLRLPFSASPMPALDEGCLIATQWGCPRRRVTSMVSFTPVAGSASQLRPFESEGLVAANPTLIGTNLFNRYGKEANMILMIKLIGEERPIERLEQSLLYNMDQRAHHSTQKRTEATFGALVAAICRPIAKAATIRCSQADLPPRLTGLLLAFNPWTAILGIRATGPPTELLLLSVFQLKDSSVVLQLRSLGRLDYPSSSPESESAIVLCHLLSAKTRPYFSDPEKHWARKIVLFDNGLAVEIGSLNPISKSTTSSESESGVLELRKFQLAAYLACSSCRSPESSQVWSRKSSSSSSCLNKAVPTLGDSESRTVPVPTVAERKASVF
ncbi:hypothetical protein LguiB_036093 [Lonicera macranthoides]